LFKEKIYLEKYEYIIILMDLNGEMFYPVKFKAEYMLNPKIVNLELNNETDNNNIIQENLLKN